MKTGRIPANRSIDFLGMLSNDPRPRYILEKRNENTRLESGSRAVCVGCCSWFQVGSMQVSGPILKTVSPTTAALLIDMKYLQKNLCEKKLE